MKKRWFIGTAALAMAGWMGTSTAMAQPRYGDDGVYYEDGTPYSDSDGDYYYDGRSRDSRYDSDGYGYNDDYNDYNDYQNSDADIYYENYYGADNPYDLYFHRSLSPHGDWVYVRGCGWVWRPFVVSSWSPYNLGYWGWGQGGWTWVSYEPFGSIVYHYGNWGWMEGYGWCWFPGYRWYPHTVQWSSYSGYIGWCPRPPRIYGYGSHSYDHNNYRRYTWVSNRNFLDRDVHRHIERPSSVWNKGKGQPRDLPILSNPSRSAVEQWSGRRPQDVVMEQINLNTHKGKVQMFVPDRNTRNEIRQHGREIVSPWIDTQRRDESRKNQPRWDRNRQQPDLNNYNNDNNNNEWWKNQPRDDRNQQNQPSPWVDSPRRRDRGQEDQNHDQDQHPRQNSDHQQPSHQWGKGGEVKSGDGKSSPPPKTGGVKSSSNNHSGSGSTKNVGVVSTGGKKKHN